MEDESAKILRRLERLETKLQEVEESSRRLEGILQEGAEKLGKTFDRSSRIISVPSGLKRTGTKTESEEQPAETKPVIEIQLVAEEVVTDDLADQQDEERLEMPVGEVGAEQQSVKNLS